MVGLIVEIKLRFTVLSGVAGWGLGVCKSAKPRSLVANKLRFAKREGPRLILLVCHLYLVSENRLTFIPAALDDTNKTNEDFFPADANCTIPTHVSHPKTCFLIEKSQPKKHTVSLLVLSLLKVIKV